jgi:phage repressor protein C with HTH and peptisase S24 domain
MSINKFTYDVNFLEIYNKLKEIEAFKKEKELADLLEVSPQAITNFKNRGKIPVGLIIRYAERNKQSVDHLLNLKGEKRMGSQKEGDDQTEPQTLIPYLREALIGIGGLEILNVELKSEWVKKTLPPDKGKLAMFLMDADNMTPTIIINDALIIDRMVDHIAGSGIYAFKKHNEIIVHRVYLALDGSIEVLNDNSSYPPEKYQKSMLDTLNEQVVGRVIWKGSQKI